MISILLQWNDFYVLDVLSTISRVTCVCTDHLNIYLFTMEMDMFFIQKIVLQGLIHYVLASSGCQVILKEWMVWLTCNKRDMNWCVIRSIRSPWSLTHSWPLHFQDRVYFPPSGVYRWLLCSQLDQVWAGTIHHENNVSSGCFSTYALCVHLHIISPWLIQNMMGNWPICLQDSIRKQYMFRSWNYLFQFICKEPSMDTSFTCVSSNHQH